MAARGELAEDARCALPRLRSVAGRCRLDYRSEAPARTLGRRLDRPWRVCARDCAKPDRRDRQPPVLLLHWKGCGARLWYRRAIWSQRATDGIMALAWRRQRFAAGGIRELQLLRHPNG